MEGHSAFFCLETRQTLDAVYALRVCLSNAALTNIERRPHAHCTGLRDFTQCLQMQAPRSPRQ